LPSSPSEHSQSQIKVAVLHTGKWFVYIYKYSSSNFLKKWTKQQLSTLLEPSALSVI
jgi:hypothetical protein